MRPSQVSIKEVVLLAMMVVSHFCLWSARGYLYHYIPVRDLFFDKQISDRSYEVITTLLKNAEICVSLSYLAIFGITLLMIFSGNLSAVGRKILLSVCVVSVVMQLSIFLF